MIKKIGSNGIYYKIDNSDNNEYKEIKGLSVIEPIIFEEPISSDLDFLKTTSGEMSIELKDKSIDSFKQVKPKRLKKKYWKKTIYYQITREKRW